MQSLLERRNTLLLIFLLGLVVLLINNHLALWDQDEAAYAGFALNMVESGNWLVPDFLWSDVHRKTPLHFWLIAIAFELIGTTEFAVRLPSALAAFSTCVLVFFMGGDVFGKLRGRGAAIIMLTSILLTGVGKISVTDSVLLFFETLAALSIFGIVKGKSPWYWLALWLGVAGGLLTKGPPVLILSFGILGILFLFHPKRLKIFLAGLFIITAGIPLLLWGWAAWQSDNGQFITWLIDWYVLKRVGGSVFGQTGPPGYFLVIFLVSFLPWLMFFPRGFARLFKGLFSKGKRTEFQLFLVAWMAAGWWIYEFIPSKLPAYAIGAYPAIGLMLSDQALRFDKGWFNVSNLFKFGWWLFLILGSVFGIGAAVVGCFSLENNLGQLGAVAAGLLFSTALITAAVMLRRGNSELAYGTIVSGTFAFLLLAWGLVFPSVEKPRSGTKQVAEYIIQNSDQKRRVVFANNFRMPSLPFYIHRSGREYWEEQNPQQLQKLYSSNKPVALVFDREKFEQFQAVSKVAEKEVDQRIHGWITDKGEEIEFLILSN